MPEKFKHNKYLIVISLLLLIFLAFMVFSDTPILQDKKYVGSIKSDKYHYPKCEWALNIKAENRVWFDTEEEAKKAGYKFCKTCRKTR